MITEYSLLNTLQFWAKQNGQKCKGIRTQQLTNEQWKWFDDELSRTSVIKIIGSGIQVLPPTNQLLRGFNKGKHKSITELCSHDIHSNPYADSNKFCLGHDKTEFCKAIFDVGENSTWVGNMYESWGLIPQERRKLLQKAQIAINRGKAKVIIFVSGDQHWSELMIKEMPQIPDIEFELGKPQTLYEVTGSAIFQEWKDHVSNSNRFRDNTEVNNVFRGKCNDPACFEASYYQDAFGKGRVCHTTLGSKKTVSVCDPIVNNFSTKDIKSKSNLTNTCSGSKYHLCSKSSYGSINVDFLRCTVRMAIRDPTKNEEAYMEIPYKC